MLAKLAGPALKHLRDEFTTQREMKRRTLEKPSAAEPFYDVARLRAELGLKE
jgi:hypothetical protein